jgi:glycosyltransferase involved in cell wall biosynthesis
MPATGPIGRIGLIGPDQTQPCGIADYVERLAAALVAECDLAFVPFPAASSSRALADCRSILVHYERSLVPDPAFMIRLGARFPGRIFAVPHEVYAEDPFAFPYASLRAPFPPALWAKRALYRWRHRAYARERRLQGYGYGAHRVIPLSGPNAELLRDRTPGKVLATVPLAFHVPPENASAPSRGELFPGEPRAVLGLFGFLNPAVDYGQILALLADLDPGTHLLILGGSRSEDGLRARIEGEAAALGLAQRVRITGWLPPDRVGPYLRLCDLFLAPLRFKSNSSSLLQLIHLGRPILASDLPLTRWLKAEGAPIDLYGDAVELRVLVRAYLSGRSRPPPNRYHWDFPAVARAYLKAMAPF